MGMGMGMGMGKYWVDGESVLASGLLVLLLLLKSDGRGLGFEAVFFSVFGFCFFSSRAMRWGTWAWVGR